MDDCGRARNRGVVCRLRCGSVDRFPGRHVGSVRVLNEAAMILYYLSFCDVKRPKGQQFLGCTVVEACSPDAAMKEATLRGLNPGGEVALVAMEVDSLDDLPATGRSYVNRFVPREEVLRDGCTKIADFEEDKDVR